MRDCAYPKRHGLLSIPAAVAADSEYAKAKEDLHAELLKHLAATNDPRALGKKAPWDHYPYYGLRRNKDWKVDSETTNE